MAGQLTVAPPGSMVIDLGKRKKKLDVDSGLDWVGYNRAPHDGPDKDSRGRWAAHDSVLSAIRQGESSLEAVRAHLGGKKGADLEEAWEEVKLHPNVVVGADGTPRWDDQSMSGIAAIDAMLEHGRSPWLREAYAKVLREELEGQPIRAKAFESARETDDIVDRLRGEAGLASLVEEWAYNGASADEIVELTRQEMRTRQLEPVAGAGDAVRFDRAHHRPLAGSGIIDEGVDAVVIAPGYAWTGGRDGSVIVHRAQITGPAEDATPSPRKPKPKNPAKPLRAAAVKKPTKPVPQELLDEMAAIRKRPIPGDRERLEGPLSKLTIEQIKDAGESVGIERRTITGTKKQQVEIVVRSLTALLGHEGITHSDHRRAGESGQDAADSYARLNEFHRRRKLAAERGDREEYAALVAGYGTAGTGPGLPPERSVTGSASRIQEIDARSGVISNRLMGNISHTKRAELFREQQQLDEERKQLIAGGAKPVELRRRTPAEEDAYMVRRKELEGQYFQTEDKTERREIQTQIDDLVRERDALRSKPDPAKPLTAKGKLETAGMQGTAANMDRLARKLREAKTVEDGRELVAGLKVAELKSLAAALGVSSLGGTKSEKIDNLLKITVGGRAVSQSLFPSMNPAKPLKATSAKPRPGALTVPTMDNHQTIADIIREPSEGDGERLTAMLSGMTLPQIQAVLTRHRPDEKLQGANKAQKIQNMVGTLVGSKLDSAAIERSFRGGANGVNAPSVNSVTYLDTPARTSGDGQFWGNHYHGDGVMGATIGRLTERQKSINVGDKRLDDALADVIIEGHRGEIGVSRRQIKQFKTISAQVGDAEAKAKIDAAIAKLSRLNVGPTLGADVKAAAPAPLKKLWDRLVVIPDTGQGGKEIDRLADIMTRWEAGELRAMTMGRELEKLTDLRHESQEGRFEVATAVREAVAEVEAMTSALRAQQNEIRTRNSGERSLLTPEQQAAQSRFGQWLDARRAAMNAYEELLTRHGREDGWPQDDPEVLHYRKLKAREDELGRDR